MKHVAGGVQVLPHRPQFMLLVCKSQHPSVHHANVCGVHRGS